MKTFSLLGLIAISFGAFACAGTPSDSEADSELNDDALSDGAEETAEAHDPLTVTVAMGGLGWAHQTQQTSDLILAHRVTNVTNKYGEVASGAYFPSIEGLPATSANLALCTSSYMDVYVYKRAIGSSSWTSIDHQKRFAKATTSGGVIQYCRVTFETNYCAPYAFGSTDADMEVDLIATGGDGQKGRKTNIVRYPIINQANCN